MLAEYLPKIMDLAQVLLLATGGLVYVGTVIVKMTQSKADDEVLLKAEGLWDKVCGWLPTLGVNPKTAALKAALEDLKQEIKKPE